MSDRKLYSPFEWANNLGSGEGLPWDCLGTESITFTDGRAESTKYGYKSVDSMYMIWSLAGHEDSNVQRLRCGSAKLKSHITPAPSLATVGIPSRGLTCADLKPKRGLPQSYLLDVETRDYT